MGPQVHKDLQQMEEKDFIVFETRVNTSECDIESC